MPYAFGINWKSTAGADGPIDIQSTAAEATPSRTASNTNGDSCTFGFPTGMQGTINHGGPTDERLKGQTFQVNIERRFTMEIGAVHAGSYLLNLGFGSPSASCTTTVEILNRADAAAPVGEFTNLLNGVVTGSGTYVTAAGSTKLEADWTADYDSDGYSIEIPDNGAQTGITLILRATPVQRWNHIRLTQVGGGGGGARMLYEDGGGMLYEDAGTMLYEGGQVINQATGAEAFNGERSRNWMRLVSGHGPGENMG